MRLYGDLCQGHYLLKNGAMQLCLGSMVFIVLYSPWPGDCCVVWFIELANHAVSCCHGVKEREGRESMNSTQIYMSFLLFFFFTHILIYLRVLVYGGEGEERERERERERGGGGEEEK